MKSDDLQPSSSPVLDDLDDDDGPRVALTDALTWVGEGKRLIAAVTLLATVASIGIGFLIPKTFTARATMLAPGSQQQSGSAAALAALGSLGGLGGLTG